MSLKKNEIAACVVVAAGIALALGCGGRGVPHRRGGGKALPHPDAEPFPLAHACAHPNARNRRRWWRRCGFPPAATT